MGEPNPLQPLPSRQPLDLDAISSGVTELSDILRGSSEEPEFDTKQLLRDCALHLQSKITQIVAESSAVGSLVREDLDAYMDHLKGELGAVEAETANISSENEVLMGSCLEEANQLENCLEGLKQSLDFILLQGLEKAEMGACVVDPITEKENHAKRNTQLDKDFKILELSQKIEQVNNTKKSLQDLDSSFKTIAAIERIEESLNGLKVIEVKGNCIKLSLRSYLPNLEGLSHEQNIELPIEPSELYHELLIEVVNGTMDFRKVEIFPNDVYIGGIFDDTKSYRTLLSKLSPLGPRSWEWFVGKVQNRIILSTLRRFIVNAANKLRHSVEYLDRDEMIVAHMMGGVDAFIKVPQGWPLSNSALSLISLKNLDHQASEISLNFLCKVEEAANSLDLHIRQCMSSFVDGIEKALMQQMHLEIQSDSTG